MTTWIFLRGLTRESRHWGDFVDIFRATVPEANVVSVDLPGNGAFNHLASPTDVRKMAGFCREELARRGILPPYALLAMSLGAMVAVAWAHAHPEEISCCVLVNTSLRPFSPFYRRLRPASWPALLRLALFGGSGRTQEEGILHLTSALRPDAAKVLDEWVAYRKDRPVARQNALRQLVAAGRYRAPRERPAPPLLLLASRNDALVHVGCSHALARAWNCEIAVHPQAGHDLPLDDAPWVAEQVRRWAAALADTSLAGVAHSNARVEAAHDSARPCSPERGCNAR